MIYREWTVADINSIYKLEKICFSDAWSYDMFESSIKSPHVYGIVACDEENIVGYASESILFELAEIENIAVSPVYRRKGIGEELLKNLENKAFSRGAEISALEVRISNTPAIKLYKKMEYEDFRLRKKYYSDGEDAMIMQKLLKGGNK